MSTWGKVNRRKNWANSLKEKLRFFFIGIGISGIGILIIWIFGDSAENINAVINFLPIPAEVIFYLPIFIGGLLMFVGLIMTIVALFRRFILGDRKYYKDL